MPLSGSVQSSVTVEMWRDVLLQPYQLDAFPAPVKAGGKNLLANILSAGGSVPPGVHRVFFTLSRLWIYTELGRDCYPSAP